MTLGLARDMAGPLDLPRVVGAVVGSSNAGAGVGFLVGGLLVDAFSAPAIFWFLFGTAVALSVGVAFPFPIHPFGPPTNSIPEPSCSSGEGFRAPPRDLEGPSLGLDLASIDCSSYAPSSHSASSPGPSTTHRSRLSTCVSSFDDRSPCNEPIALLFGFSFFIALFVVPQLGALPSTSGGLRALRHPGRARALGDERRGLRLGFGRRPPERSDPTGSIRGRGRRARRPRLPPACPCPWNRRGRRPGLRRRRARLGSDPDRAVSARPRNAGADRTATTPASRPSAEMSDLRWEPRSLRR